MPSIENPKLRQTIALLQVRMQSPDREFTEQELNTIKSEIQSGDREVIAEELVGFIRSYLKTEPKASIKRNVLESISNLDDLNILNINLLGLADAIENVKKMMETMELSNQQLANKTGEPTTAFKATFKSREDKQKAAEAAGVPAAV